MTTTPTQTLSTNETAALLTKRLGSIRSWYAFLSDCVRGRQDLYSHRLMPCGEMKDCNGSFRPRYAVEDINEFVTSVIAAAPPGTITPAAPVTLAIDHGKHWRRNRFDRNGNAIAKHRALWVARPCGAFCHAY